MKFTIEPTHASATLAGLPVTEGAVQVLSVAACVVAPPHELVKTARYRLPSSLACTTNVRVVLVAPEISVNGPFITLTCHCTVGVGLPLAAAVNVTLLPGVTVWEAGF